MKNFKGLEKRREAIRRQMLYPTELREHYLKTPIAIKDLSPATKLWRVRQSFRHKERRTGVAETELLGRKYF